MASGSPTLPVRTLTETDEPAGIHRIAVAPDVFSGAAVPRKMLGRWPAPRAVKLWPAGKQLFLGEGIETVLAAATRLQFRGTPMRPAWAACSSTNIAKFPVLPGIDNLMIFLDNDEAGTAALNECCAR